MPLSAKQCEYLAICWACFETEPKVDYEKFRQLAGLKTAASARELMRVTKIKLKEEYGQALTPGKNSTSAAVTTASKKAASAKSTNNTSTSTRKRKAPITPTTPAHVAEDEDDDPFTFSSSGDIGGDEEYSSTKKQKTGGGGALQIKEELGLDTPMPSAADEDEF